MERIAAPTHLLTKLFGTFRAGIRQCKPALAYLKERNLHLSPDMGYNGGRFHLYGNLGETELQACLQTGLLTPYYQKEGKQFYYSWARDCILFPLKDGQGNIVSLYGRSLKRAAENKHHYLPDCKGLYPGYPGSDTQTLILTESIIDAATLLQHYSKEHTGVLACYGANGLTAEHRAVIGSLHELKEIIFFFKGEQSGITSAETYAEELYPLLPQLTISRVSTPQGEDVNSLAQGHTPDIFDHLLKERTPLFLALKKIGNEPSENTLQAAFGTLHDENPECMTYRTDMLLISLWGGIEKENLGKLKVSLHVQHREDKYKTFRDDANLYNHSSTERLIRNVSARLEVSTTYISQVITDLTAQLESYRIRQREMTQQPTPQHERYEMSEAEEQAALEVLKDPQLVSKTQDLIAQSGLVGEQKNGLLLFFLYLSRFSEEPLHAIIFGKSGSGKTYLQTKVSECLPEESVRTITSLTENTLYYSPKGFWQHKVLLIEDLEGVYNAFLPLRELMSKQSISKLTTDKDPKGNNIQKVLTVQGPVCVSGATTKERIYEDNANRSFLLHIDESKEHLGEVMDYQRKQYAGMINETTQQQARKLLQNIQRMLHKTSVVNPYATQLYIPEGVFKKLRTNMHYLRLIEIISFYHQYQREATQGCIETSLNDIATANELIKDSFLRKSDELSGELRSFFEGLKTMTDKDKGFLAKDLRKALRMHPMKLARHLVQLETRGYIKRTGNNKQTGYQYEVTEWEDYQHLQEGIHLLDKTLEQIKRNKNGIHNTFTPSSQVAM